MNIAGSTLVMMLAMLGLASCGQNASNDASTDQASSGYYDESIRLNDDEQSKVSTASAVIAEVVQAGDSGIPEALLENAHGIAVIPNVVKGAIGVGGRWGKGLVSERLANGQWSPPVNVSMGGASYGFQVGVSSTDLVLVFTDPKGVTDILGDGLKLGADVQVTAGPVGRSAEFGTNARFGTAIYSYSRSEGIFAGAALDGAVIQVDESGNREMYGRDVDASTLLAGEVKPPIGTKPFLDALRTHVSPGTQG